MIQEDATAQGGFARLCWAGYITCFSGIFLGFVDAGLSCQDEWQIGPDEPPGEGLRS